MTKKKDGAAIKPAPKAAPKKAATKKAAPKKAVAKSSKNDRAINRMKKLIARAQRQHAKFEKTHEKFVTQQERLKKYGCWDEFAKSIKREPNFKFSDLFVKD